MFNINGYATIYNFDKDKQSDIYKSTLFNSNKNNDSQGKTWYERQYWNANFVGSAKEYIRQNLENGIDFEGARIKINNGIIRYREYLDRKTSEKRKAYFITVFEFEIEKLSDKLPSAQSAAPNDMDYPDYPDYPDIDLNEGETF